MKELEINFSVSYELRVYAHVRATRNKSSVPVWSSARGCGHTGGVKVAVWATLCAFWRFHGPPRRMTTA